MKNLSTQSKWITVALALCGLLMLAGCGRGKSTPTSTSERSDPTSVRISSDMERNFKVEPVAIESLDSTQEITGRIEANDQWVTRIGASVTGRVTDVLVDIGHRVKSGQVLAHLSSPELTQAQLNYLRANAATTMAERAVDRARQLIQADVIGFAELQRRESELSIARAEWRAAADQLRLLGFSEAVIELLREKGQLSSVTTITATRSGVVVERKISAGQVAQPGDPLFTVADLSSVWVVGALPEQAAASVQLDQAVDIEVPALGSRNFSGKVVFVSDTIHPETRTLTVRTQVDNPKGMLKPQMLATLRITGQSVQQLAIPEAAVVRENDRDHVFVQTAPGQFKLTPVSLGVGSRGLRAVQSGLTQGTPIVVEGAFHMNNERKRAELE